VTISFRACSETWLGKRVSLIICRFRLTREFQEYRRPPAFRGIEGEHGTILKRPIATRVLASATLIHVNIMDAGGKIKRAEASTIVEARAEDKQSTIWCAHDIYQLRGEHVGNAFVFWITSHLQLIHLLEVYQLLSNVIQRQAFRSFFQCGKPLRQLRIEDFLRDRVLKIFANGVEHLVRSRADVDGHPIARATVDL